jgi:hypothetical protein
LHLALALARLTLALARTGAGWKRWQRW